MPPGFEENQSPSNCLYKGSCDFCGVLRSHDHGTKRGRERSSSRSYDTKRVRGHRPGSRSREWQRAERRSRWRSRSGSRSSNRAASKVLCLKDVVDPVEIVSDLDYEYVMDKVGRECEKFGTLVKLVMPRPVGIDAWDEEASRKAGFGMAFVEYEDVEAAAKARQGLNGQIFEEIQHGIPMVVDFYPEQRFLREDYGA
ncbi:OLC1v1036930C1 [Oldenlandia corymbosa var. corymbosa]|uniref:OLC1v1036930C1 n=1 Tax=Oldenlandia corymbosa var. corymbosa TaxID=529605 RepID=A0AAV1CXM3_OLDCO|nr:OLC1v1036930C1 [Oldenlandia corymbosa var. corymbosa]